MSIVTNTQLVNFKKIPQALLVAALIGVVGNSIIWFVGNAAAGMSFPLPAVFISSVLGVLVGAALFALLAKFTKKPYTIFSIISIVFLVLFAYGPINAMTTGPAGGPPFNMTTMIAAQVMHIISGVSAIWAFNKYPRA